MGNSLAELHRRIAVAEHGVEESLKRLASWITMRNPVGEDDAEKTRKRMTEDAEKISERAEEHKKSADRIENRSAEN